MDGRQLIPSHRRRRRPRSRFCVVLVVLLLVLLLLPPPLLLAGRSDPTCAAAPWPLGPRRHLQVRGDGERDRWAGGNFLDWGVTQTAM